MAAEEREKTAKSIARYVRVSPRKARLIVDEIRGKHVEEAFNVIAFSPKRAAKFVWKALESAVANAERNHGLERRNLYVSEIRVDEGPKLKRSRPRGMGRATIVEKRSSHIYVVVQERGGAG